MSFISSSLNNVYEITAKINALQQGETTTSNDPQETFQLLVSKNFNDMLSSLLSKDDDDDDDSNDIFSSFINNDNYGLSSLTNSASSTNSTTSTNSTSSTGQTGDQSAESLAMQAALLSNQAYAGII